MSDGHERGEPESGEPETTTSPGQVNTEAGQGADSAGPKARILILEDEAWDAELAQRLLTDGGVGFTAVVVDTRESFVEQLAAFRPDLILADFSLPGFSGENALKIAQEECPNAPFIIWSGMLGDEAAVGLIKDPPARLPAAIQRALAEAEQRARLAQIEDQLLRAQRLASLGQLAAAEETLSRTRQLLAAARQQALAADSSS